MTRLIMTAAACALLGGTAAQAVTITEGVDFPNAVTIGSTPIATLDVGSNVIQGTLAGSCALNFGFVDCNLAGGFAQDNQDSFVLTLAPGQILRSFGYSLSGTGPDGFMARLSASPNTALPGTSTEQVTAAVPSTGLFPDGGATPPGDYSISIFGGTANAVGDYSLSYTLTFDVAGDAPAPVPLPASGLLILGGLVGLGAMRRARKGVSV